MHVGVSSTQICPLECGKLNVRSLVLIFALKIVALRISNFDNVMVPIISKSSLAARSTFSFYVTPFRSKYDWGTQ
jgi:hypothetical protein